MSFHEASLDAVGSSLSEGISVKPRPSMIIESITILVSGGTEAIAAPLLNRPLSTFENLCEALDIEAVVIVTSRILRIECRTEGVCPPAVKT